MRAFVLLLAGALLAPAPGLVLAAENPGRVVEDTDLLRRPDTGAGVIARLAKDTPVERFERRGGWVSVQPPDEGAERGWVRVWKVRDVEQGEGLTGALKRFSRKVAGYFSDDPAATTEGEYTATIGVRGLGGSDHGKRIGDAPPDLQALREARRHAVDPGAARAFAREAGLSARPNIRTPGAGVSEAEDWDGW